jgi:hypothetical protein
MGILQLLRKKEQPNVLKPKVGRDVKVKRIKSVEGYRADLDKNFRSAMEANVYRYAMYLKDRFGVIARIEIEPHLFTSEDGLPKGFNYLPDQLWVYSNGRPSEYVEVKGVWDTRSRRALAIMKKYRPDIRLTIIGPLEYQLIRKHYKNKIRHWE